MTASSVSVLDGVSGIDAARLIEKWRAVESWAGQDEVTASYFMGRFDQYAVEHQVGKAAQAECKRIARILEAS